MRNGTLLAAVLLVGAFILLKPDSSGIALSDLSPQQVSSIRIIRPGMPEIRLARMNGAWKIISPVSVAASPEAVKSVLSILGARSDDKLESANLSDFGLDKPVLRLYLDDQEYDFGMLNTLTGQQYVKRRDTVYLVSAKYALIPSLRELEEHAGTP